MTLRFQCVGILQKIFEKKRFFNELKDEIGNEGRSFANQLVLTALRRKVAIDRLLQKYIKKSIPQKNKILHYILLAASTELLYLDTPDYAVINEYVNIAKCQTNKYAAGMVNAVLKNVLKHKQELANQAFFPGNFVEILKKDYALHEIELMEKQLLAEPPLDITPIKSHKNVAQNLGGKLFENGTVRLYQSKNNVACLKGYDEGLWFVQDLAASLVISSLGNLQGLNILDLCAAPGGKTAQLLTKGAFVTAVDVSINRLQTLKNNITRLQLNQNLTTICTDGADYLDKQAKLFDIILLDAPCSASGTFRRHPEVMYFKTLDDVNKQSIIQQKLLEKAAKHIKPSGMLVYCTCSISTFEGEKQVVNFLKNHTDFKLEPFQNNDYPFKDAIKINHAIFDKQVLRTLPYTMQNEGGMDSFFAACLKRVN